MKENEVQIPKFYEKRQKDNEEINMAFAEMAKNNKRAILDEVKYKEKIMKIDKMKKKKNIQKGIRYTAICSVSVAAVLSGSIILVNKVNYENKPVTKVVKEMAIDSGFYRTGDGKSVDDKMTKDELLSYIIDKELSLYEIEEQVKVYSNKESINLDFVKEKMAQTNPEVFEKDTYKKK